MTGPFRAEPLTPELIRSFADEFEKDPRWRKCYPRIYPATNGQYYSSKLPALQMMRACTRGERGYLGKSEEVEIVWASCLAEKRVPMYWIAHDMALAIRETRPPGEIDWHEMKLPFEDAIFMLPRGVITHDDLDEGDVSYISYSRGRKGRVVPNLCQVGPELFEADGHFTFYASTYPGGHFIHWNIPLDECKTIDLGKVDELIQRFSDKRFEHHSGYLYSPSMTPADNRVMIKALHMIFGILLFMTRRPNFITAPRLIRKVATKNPKDLAREFWSCGVVGEHYRIRHVGDVLGGTHASPRLHWCRGHWRDQHYGTGNALIKEIWVEPFLRGVDDSAV